MDLQVRLGDEVFYSPPTECGKEHKTLKCVVASINHKFDRWETKGQKNIKEFRIIPVNEDGSVNVDNGIHVDRNEIVKTKKVKVFAYLTKSNKLVMVEEEINGTTSKRRVPVWDQYINLKLPEKELI